MRLFSLAVIAAVVATGCSFAADGDKKADKKAWKTTGTLTKVDGDKLVVSVKGDTGDKTDVTFTTNDKTKFFKEEVVEAPKDGDKKPDEAKPEEKKADEPKNEDPAKDGDKKADKKANTKRTEIKLTDLKTGSKVAVTAGEDKVATEVVQLPPKAKKEEKKPDAPKDGDKKADEKKLEDKKPEEKK